VAVKKVRIEKSNMMMEYKGKVGHCDRNMGHGNHLTLRLLISYIY